MGMFLFFKTVSALFKREEPSRFGLEVLGNCCDEISTRFKDNQYLG